MLRVKIVFCTVGGNLTHSLTYNRWELSFLTSVSVVMLKKKKKKKSCLQVWKKLSPYQLNTPALKIHSHLQDVCPPDRSNHISENQPQLLSVWLGRWTSVQLVLRDAVGFNSIFTW